MAKGNRLDTESLKNYQTAVLKFQGEDILVIDERYFTHKELFCLHSGGNLIKNGRVFFYNEEHDIVYMKKYETQKSIH